MKGRRIAAFALLLSLAALYGCKGERAGIGERFQAEKMFWDADRGRQELRVSGRNPSDAEVDALVAKFRAVTQRFPVAEVFRRRDISPELAKQIAALSAASHVAIGELRMSQKKFEEAKKEFAALYAFADFDTGVKISTAIDWGLCEEGLARWLEAIKVYKNLLREYPYESLDARNQAKIARLPLRIAGLYRQAEMEQESSEALKEARAYYRRIAEANADNLEGIGALMLVAESYGMEDEWKKSERVWESLVSKTKQVQNAESLNPQVVLRLAQIRADRLKEPARAIEVLREFESEHPDSSAAPARLIMAQIYMNDGQLDSALAVLNRFDEIGAPSATLMAKGLYMKAQIRETQGDWDQALADYKRVTLRYPLTTWGLNAPVHIGSYYQKIGDGEAANKAYEAAAETYQGLLKTYREETRLAIEARSYLAECYARLGRWNEARDTLVYLAEKFPQTNAGMLALLRAAEIAERNLGSRDEAQKYLNQAIERYPDSPVAKRAQEMLARVAGE